MYIHRELESHFTQIEQEYPIILLCGPRQVGKTTMLQELAGNQKRTYVTLDDLEVRRIAVETPQLFFDFYQPPILIDEVQYAPQLFPYIKMLADSHRINGEFWLTGSQQFELMKGVQESLAGRVAILSLYSLSMSEIHQNKTMERSFLPNRDELRQKALAQEKTSYQEVFDTIIRGGMPRLYQNHEMNRDRYFKNYIETYLIKDAMDYGGIGNPIVFQKFLVSCAARTAQQVNYASLAQDCGISEPTAKTWINLLQGMGIVFLLYPYENTIVKTMAKTPKLHFYDTGLASYLTGWPSGEILEKNVQAGPLFETLVVSEIKKSIEHTADPNTYLYYYRDKQKIEIDLLIERNRTIYPIEIKKNAKPDINMINSFKQLQKLSTVTIGEGGIIYPGKELYPLDDMNTVIPISLI